MAKFDVYRLGSHDHFVLDCQADLLSHLDTRFVVPLIPLDSAPKPAARLNPLFDIEGQRCSMVTQFAGAVPARDLRTPVASLGDHDLTIGNALDLLISGF